MSAILAQQYAPQTSVISAVVGVAVELQAIHKQQFVRSAEIERSADKAAEREQNRQSIENGAFKLELSDAAAQATQSPPPVASASDSAATNPQTGGSIDITA